MATKRLTLTKRQKLALAQMERAEYGTAPLSRSIFNRLVKRGFAYDTMQVYEPTKWNRVIARLPIAGITDLGRTALAAAEGVL